MNGAHLHLALNHLPVFAIVFAIGFIGWGMKGRHPALLRSGLVLVVTTVAGQGEPS